MHVCVLASILTVGALLHGDERRRTALLWGAALHVIEDERSPSRRSQAGPARRGSGQQWGRGSFTCPKVCVVIELTLLGDGETMSGAPTERSFE